jgi:uncharacterized protein (DUF885 family)
MTRVYDLAHRYVEEQAALDPVAATSRGVAGHDSEMTDYSPEGAADRAALDARTLTALDAAPVENERGAVAAGVMRERLKLAAEYYAAREHLRDLSVLGSPTQAIRRVFDLMPQATADDWRTIATRLALVQKALESYQESLAEGLRLGIAAARRQAMACAEQSRTWAGLKGQQSYFDRQLAAFDRSGLSNGALRADLEAAVTAANTAYAAFASFLAEEYAPRTAAPDPVWRDRYALAARLFTGAALDLEDTYRWGWEQFRWVESEMRSTAGRLRSGMTIEEATQLLETDPARAIEGEEPFQHWMQDLQDRTISELDGVHFDVPAPVRRVEARIAPPGGALAMYYTPPSEDFSRPGRTWYPTGGKSRFPLWREVSIAYHEGVPGHHFQIGTTRYLAKELSRYQRIAIFSGYSEGWALYAERLMGELGYLENPDYYLGMLSAQALRSVRVIIDIGMHLGLRIPRESDFSPGAKWTPALGLEFILSRSRFPPEFVKSEVDRYLGMPGQAISYKVGERVWLESRETARRKAGTTFDLKAWHNRALSLGPMGLDQLRASLG